MRVGPWLAVSLIASGCLLPELKDLGGGSDASSSDVTVVPDAGAGEAAVPCPSGWFCDDFDKGPLGATWTSMGTLDGTLTLESGGISPPNLMRMDLTTPKGSSRHAYLSKTFDFAPTHAICTMNVRIVIRPTSGDYQLIELRDLGAHLVYIKVFATSTELGEEFNGADGGVDNITSVTTAKGGIPDAMWTAVTFDADYVKKVLTMTVTPFGGKATTILLPNLTVPSGVKAVTLNLGDPGDSNDPLFTAQFDDLRCNVL